MKNKELFSNLKAEEAEIIEKIAARVVDIFIKCGGRCTKITLMMDLSATHLNGCPLRLQELLAATNSDLLHDIGGIAINLNRNTGALENCFVPRYAKR